MGTDKALLPFRGGALGAHVAAIVAAAAGSAAFVGDPAKYADLGYPVLPDGTAGAGPLAGIETALSYTRADWNLVVACDMPAISVGFLSTLLDAAEQSAADALVPCAPGGRWEPLCAVYHRRCGPVLRRALEGGIRKITDAFPQLDVAPWPVEDIVIFENLNTPEQWAAYHDAH